MDLTQLKLLLLYFKERPLIMYTIFKGFISYGICSTLLKISYNAHPSMHHSFGDTEFNEFPHITGPFWSFVDRLIITRPNELPPPLKETFPEDIDNRKSRGSKSTCVRTNNDGSVNYDVIDSADEVDLDSIYSFSHRTTKFDIVNWQIVNVPFLKPMNMTTFWGDADLRLVAYSIPYINTSPSDESRNKSKNIHSNKSKSQFCRDISNYKIAVPKVHSQNNIDYIFSLEIKHVYNHPEIILDNLPSSQSLINNRHLDKINRDLIGTSLISIVFATFFIFLIVYRR